MFSKITTRLKRIIKVIQFGFLTLRYAGLQVALQKMAHQVYGSTIFLYQVSDIGRHHTSPPRFPCYTVKATHEDVKTFFHQMHNESNDGKYQLLIRKWYHERGFGTPYVQKTIDGDEVCAILWLVTAKDIENSGFKNRFPELQSEDCMLENVYTLERFRGKGIQSTAAHQILDILSALGLIRMKSIIAEDNKPMLSQLQKGGHHNIFERVQERHLLFRVSRKTLERYDPPIPLAAFLERK